MSESKFGACARLRSAVSFRSQSLKTLNKGAAHVIYLIVILLLLIIIIVTIAFCIISMIVIIIIISMSGIRVGVGRLDYWRVFGFATRPAAAKKGPSETKSLIH